jgi:hypothetical protein
VKGKSKFPRIPLLITCVMLMILYIINFKDVNRFSRYHTRKILGTNCVDYKQAVFSKKLNNIMPDYIGYSSLSGIKKCRDENEILEKVSRGELFKIRNGTGFYIEEMSHSYPYLTKEAKDLLVEIGIKFREKISDTRLKGSRFKITSMTRTTEKLKSLRGINTNTSLNSPHMYGNAVDISYIRFSTRKLFVTECDKKYLMEALAEVIWELKKEKKCWATFERKQFCYHVVAR